MSLERFLEKAIYSNTFNIKYVYLMFNRLMFPHESVEGIAVVAHH